ncbi:MAG: DUF1566 domain-containing protein [Bacteroidales bacterium]|nr:DUF1566 domain-containing protein [Bacteroidales bacterium]
MKKTLLILSIITLILAGCKKFDEIEASKVEIEEEKIEKGWDYIKINVEYDYPVELEAVSLYLSEKEDMSGAETHECNVEGKKFSVEVEGLKAGKDYYYCYEYYNEYEKVKGEKQNINTISKPVVITKEVSSVNTISATLNGSVTNNDAINKVSEMGFCWDTKQNPTIEGNHYNNGGMSGTGTSDFSYNLTSLQDNVTYYVRAYANTNYGIVYGEEKSFSTVEITLPIVTTKEVTNIGTSTATCGGNVTSEGNGIIISRGVCWSTSPNPTINDNKTTDGSGIGLYSSNLSNLSDNTTYYVRAYATNEKGTSYGEEKSFTTVEIVLPTVTTNTVTNIKATTATCGGNVTSDGNSTVTARGVCWSTSPNPTINDNKTTDGSGTGSYTSNLTNLSDNTTYYVRAYATNEKGTSYGEEKSFTTLERTFENGYEYVDLGLSVKWATCNVGASKAEDYGDYFAWGETSVKETYDEDNCLTYELSYSELQAQGYIDSEGNLTSSHDASTANWGGDWRMPTYDELKELSNNCTWTWTTQNGVNGYNVEGPNGNSIFLPAAGFRNGSSLCNAGSSGYYWSSTPGGYYFDLLAYYLIFGSGDHYMLNHGRCSGLSVRPVVE